MRRSSFKDKKTFGVDGLMRDFGWSCDLYPRNLSAYLSIVDPYRLFPSLPHILCCV